MNNATRSNDSIGDSFRTTTRSLLVFCIAALALVLTTLFGGGQPWAVLCLLVLVIHSWTDQHLKALAFLVPGMLWLIFFRVTLNRELFFPYAMYLAAHVSLLLCRRLNWLCAVLGGILIVITFLVIRYLQQATSRVLAVEFGVAAAILGLTLLAAAAVPKNHWAHAAIAVAAALFAYMGLAI